MKSVVVVLSVRVIRRAFFISVVCSCLVVNAAVIAAQNTLAVEGTVRDSTGAPVEGARVEVSGPGTRRAVSTGASGTYRVDGLGAGRYTVRADWSGFATATTNVDLTSATVSVDLTLGNVVASESLTVPGIAPNTRLDAPAETASRLGLSARETPATINVITSEEAQARGLTTTVEVLNRVPAVSSSVSPGQPGVVAIRGFAGDATSQSFNGIRVASSTFVSRNYDSWSFDRTEVLKGPASVLYGEGALAGAVNYVSKRPDFSRRHGEALVSYGSLGTARLAAGATGPVGGRAAYRADAVWSRTDGYIDANQFDTLALTGAIDVKLTSTAVLTLSADHFRDTYDVPYTGTPIVPRALARQPSDLITDGRGFVLDRGIRDTNFNSVDADAGSHETWLRARLDWPLSPTWKVVNEFYVNDALRTYRREDFSFAPASSLVDRSAFVRINDFLFYGDRITLGSDARLAGRRNRFTAGVEANRDDFSGLRRFGAIASVDPYNPVRGSFPVDSAASFPGAGNRTNVDTTIDAVSVFAEDAFTVIPRLTLVGGLRFDHLDADRGMTDLNTGGITAFKKSYTPISGRAGLVIDVLPQTQLFGQYTSAVAPVATILLVTQAQAAFDLTTGESWEGGIKTTAAGGRLEATASVFTIDQDNILTRDPVNPNLTIQGGSQASTGVEFSAGARISPRLRVDGSAAVMNVRFKKLLEAGGADRTGNVPQDVPERTAGLWASYQLPRLPINVAGGLTYHGRFFTTNANTTRVAGYTLLDAQVGWTVGPGDITIRAKNLTDALTAEWSAGANAVMLGAPRTVNLTYQLRF